MSKVMLKVFRAFPDNPYSVSSDGKEVVNLALGRVLRQRLRKNGYLDVTIRRKTGAYRTMGVHRLVAKLFVEKPVVDPGVRLVVNHIDGDKTNNDYRNLEWVTYQENALHAGSLGLTSKCIPISVRDVTTGVVTKYPSFLAAAKDQGVSKDTIAWRFTKPDETRVYPEMKQYRKGHSDDPWDTSKDTVEPPRAGNVKSISVRDVETDTVTIYDRISDYASLRGVSTSVLTRWLNLPNQPVLPGRVQMKYLSDSTPWRRVMDIEGELISWAGGKRVRVITEETGEVEIFDSAVKCAKALNILPSTLNYRLNGKVGRVYPDGKTYEYIQPRSTTDESP